MKPYLLDVNVLLALAWPSHVHHRTAQTWFAERRTAGFRTCPLTEIGFVRISSNPKFSSEAVFPSEALLLLKQMKSMPEHTFWTDDLPATTALLNNAAVLAHRQITDAYLLALAKIRGGILATFDRGALSLDPSRASVELVGAS